MTTNQKAALLIRSLMRDLAVTTHIVYPADKSQKAVVSDVVLRELEAADKSA